MVNEKEPTICADCGTPILPGQESKRIRRFPLGRVHHAMLNDCLEGARIAAFREGMARAADDGSRP